MPPHMSQSNQPLRIDPRTFRQDFRYVRDIGQGTEGIVSRWERVDTRQAIAVKVPRSANCSIDLHDEIKAIMKVGTHEHVATLLAYHVQHAPIGPALMLELAQWGDVSTYRHHLLACVAKVPEMTLWKFLKDMSLALDWLHNGMGVSHIHGDLKPNNILVYSPSGWNNELVPRLPVFKITDLTRMQPATANVKYYGTYEYGPPLAERERKQTPAVDVWAIGASLQYFSLGVLPVQNKQEFIDYQSQKGGPVPTMEDLRTEKWRKIIPHQYRPLYMDPDFQRENMGIPVPAQYSIELQRWYEKLFEENPSKRASSSWLVAHYVPLAINKILTMVREEERQELLRNLLRGQAMWQERQAQVVFGDGQPGLRNIDVSQGAAGVLQEIQTAREHGMPMQLQTQTGFMAPQYGPAAPVAKGPRLQEAQPVQSAQFHHNPEGQQARADLPSEEAPPIWRY